MITGDNVRTPHRHIDNNETPFHLIRALVTIRIPALSQAWIPIHANHHGLVVIQSKPNLIDKKKPFTQMELSMWNHINCFSYSLPTLQTKHDRSIGSSGRVCTVQPHMSCKKYTASIKVSSTWQMSKSWKREYWTVKVFTRAMFGHTRIGVKRFAEYSQFRPPINQTFTRRLQDDI